MNMSNKKSQDYWDTHDSSKELDWSKARKVSMPKLKHSLKSVSIRLPESMIAELKVMANQRDVPYQALVKMFIAEQIKKERA